MKKYTAVFALGFILTACGPDQGENRPENMPTITQEAPTSDPNGRDGSMDTTTSGTQDSSTVIDYDTSSKRR